MVIIRIKGGLGNQLFQYAAAQSLAKRLNQPLLMDISFYPEQSLRSFKLNKLQTKNNGVISELPILYRILNNSRINYVARKLNCRIIPFIDSVYCNETRSMVNKWFFDIEKNNVYLNGYFQSEDYFKDIRNTLLEEFRPCYSYSDEFLKVLSEIQLNNSVAVHVRRGDFVKAQYNYNPHHYLLGEKYYSRAISFIESNIQDPEYYWFSDDIEWVKQNFGIQDNYHFITMHTENPDIDEMMLMKNCKSVIAANSTFSWWAAWLNENPNAIVTVPDKRYGNESMIPKKWIKIAVE